ncbi:MAG: HAD family phosphatase [Deltaproteobacteria bacterium]|nr:HAD family phosphatase [Deltaproteobacteria bacterium]
MLQGHCHPRPAWANLPSRLMAEPFIQAVLFDFDGVMVDSEPLHLRLFQRVLAGDGIDLTRELYYARYLHLDDEGLFRAVYEDTGRPVSEKHLHELVQRKEDIFMEEALHGEGQVRMFPGVADLVRDLHHEGVPVAVASGALASEINPILEHFGLRGCFTAVIGARECGRHKPHPEPYERAFGAMVTERTGTGPVPVITRALAIEDSAGGLQSARAAGCRVMAVTNTYPAERLRPLADVVVDRLPVTFGELDRIARGDAST